MVLVLRLSGVLAALWLGFFPGLQPRPSWLRTPFWCKPLRRWLPANISRPRLLLQLALSEPALADNTLRRLLVALGRAYQAQGRARDDALLELSQG